MDFCLKSIPIHPWPHQIKILRRVAQNFPQSFLIADEVGLGKTIETGLILRYLLLSKKVKRVLILAPASVQPQWQEELREKFNLHFWSYTSTEFKDPYKQTMLQGAVKQEVINFWQVMSSDYFQRGGQPCSRLEQFLTKQNRILAYKMQDTCC